MRATRLREAPALLLRLSLRFWRWRRASRVTQGGTHMYEEDKEEEEEEDKEEEEVVVVECR